VLEKGTGETNILQEPTSRIAAIGASKLNIQLERNSG